MVVGKEEIQCNLTHLFELFAEGRDHLALFYRGGAGGDAAPGSLNVHNAETTGGRVGHLLVVTKIGDLNIVLKGRFENRRTLVRCDGSPINRYFYGVAHCSHISFCESLLAISSEQR